MSGVAGPTGGRGRPAEPILPTVGPAELALAEGIERMARHLRLQPVCRTAARGDDPWLSDRHADRKTAVAACQGCPVTVECLATAHELGARFGVWGGVDLTGRSNP